MGILSIKKMDNDNYLILLSCICNWNLKSSNSLIFKLLNHRIRVLKPKKPISNQIGIVFKTFQIAPWMEVFPNPEHVFFCNIVQTANVQIILQIGDFHLFCNLILRSPHDILGISFVFLASQCKYSVHNIIVKSRLFKRLSCDVGIFYGIMQQPRDFGFGTFASCGNSDGMSDIIRAWFVLIKLIKPKTTRKPLLHFAISSRMLCV